MTTAVARVYGISTMSLPPSPPPASPPLAIIMKRVRAIAMRCPAAALACSPALSRGEAYAKVMCFVVRLLRVRDICVINVCCLIFNSKKSAFAVD